MKNWIFYVMEASDEEFDTEEVRKLVKRLDELDPIPLPWKSDEEATTSTLRKRHSQPKNPAVS